MRIAPFQYLWFLGCLASLALPAPAQTNLVVLARDGAWTWFNDPRALFHHGVLYFGYVRHHDGKAVLSCFNPQTGERSDLWESSRSQADDHDNPGLLTRSDDTLLAVQSRHGNDSFFVGRVATTTNPVSPAEWAGEQDLPDTSAALTYANPVQLSAEGGRVYVFCRNLNYNPTVFTSSDGGGHWSKPQVFIHNGAGGIRPYVKYASDGVRRIDFLYTDGHPRDVTNSLYHVFYEEGAVYRTDGALLRRFADLPIDHEAGERGSLIYRYSDAPASNPDDHIPAGRAWCWEIGYQSNGAPVCVFSVRRDRVAGADWSAARIYYYYARWTGTRWEKHFIAQAGRPLYAAENDYAGGICLDPEHPETVYCSSNAAEPGNLRDTTHVSLGPDQRYEIWRGVTPDGGRNFRWTPVTRHSDRDNLRPYIPRHQKASPPAVIWFRGVYSKYTDYDCEVVGLFPQLPAAVSGSVSAPDKARSDSK